MTNLKKNVYVISNKSTKSFSKIIGFWHIMQNLNTEFLNNNLRFVNSNYAINELKVSNF